MDKKVKEIKGLQELIDHRTEVENQAVELISQCKFDEAQELLATLDVCEEPKQDIRVDGKVTFYKLFRILNKFWVRDFPECVSYIYLSVFGDFRYFPHDNHLSWSLTFISETSVEVLFYFFFRQTDRGDFILSLKFYVYDDPNDRRSITKGGMNFWEEDLAGYGISFSDYKEVYDGKEREQQEYTA